MKTFYDFEANNIKGQTVSMKAYEGKTVVVVNTASKCGFTPQYEGLEALYQKYKNQVLVILGFPCNQFGKQESGSSDEIEKQSSGIFGSKIKWNFTKFIINSKGVPVKRFSPTTKPEKMEKTIIKLLQQ